MPLVTKNMNWSTVGSGCKAGSNMLNRRIKNDCNCLTVNACISVPFSVYFFTDLLFSFLS